MLDVYETKGWEETKLWAEKERIQVGTNTVNVVIESQNWFRKFNRKELDSLGCQIISEEHILGTVVEISFNKLRDLCDLGGLHFIRPIVTGSDVNECEKLSEIFGKGGAKNIVKWFQPSSGKSINVDEGLIILNLRTENEIKAKEIIRSYGCCAVRKSRYKPSYRVKFSTENYTLDEILEIFAHDPETYIVEPLGVGRALNPGLIRPKDQEFSKQ